MILVWAAATLNCPLLAAIPVPFIPSTKSAIDSFFEAFESFASMIAILSAAQANLK